MIHIQHKVNGTVSLKQLTTNLVSCNDERHYHACSKLGECGELINSENTANEKQLDIAGPQTGKAQFI